MKPTSPLSLLLFLRLVSAAPLPIPIVLPDCKTSACTAFVSNPNTPPARLTEPHFPTHQVTSITSDEVFDNTQVTPSSKVPPHVALAVPQPLSSAFLKSLSNPASKPAPENPIFENAAEEQATETENLPAKPTSALPELRKEDARLYWASRGGATTEDAEPARQVVEVDVQSQKAHQCGDMKYYDMQRVKVTRDYSDFMVVGLVLLFLAVVVALEAVEKIEGLRNFFLDRSQSSRRGQIYLEDDIIIFKKSFPVQQTTSRNKVGTESTESRAVHYDFDACEKA